MLRARWRAPRSGILKCGWRELAGDSTRPPKRTRGARAGLVRCGSDRNISGLTTAAGRHSSGLGAACPERRLILHNLASGVLDSVGLRVRRFSEPSAMGLEALRKCSDCSGRWLARYR